MAPSDTSPSAELTEAIGEAERNRVLEQALKLERVRAEQVRMTPAELDDADGHPGPILIVDDPERPDGALNRGERRARFGVPRNAEGRTRHAHRVRALAIRQQLVRAHAKAERRAHQAANRAAAEVAS